MKKEKRKVLITFKLTSKEMQMLIARSVKYTGGNASAWIREAIFTYKR
jgi:hypothetical protein